MRLHRLLLAGLVLPLPLAAQETESATLASYRQARAVLDSALAAHGGEARLRALRSIQLRYEGTSHWRNQSPGARPPWATTPSSGRFIFDFAGARSLWDSRSEFPGGFHNHSRHLFAASGSWTANYILQSWFARNDSAGTMRRGLNRYLPPGHLLTARDRAGTLRYQGTSRHDGRPHDVLLYTLPDGGAQVALHVDRRSHLLSKVEQLATDPQTGDATFDIEFSEYRPVAGIPLPARRVARRAGDVAEDFRLMDLGVDEAVPDSFFVRPPAFIEDGTAPADTSLVPLAPGVWLVRGVAGGNNSLAVEFDDHLMVVEAYGSSAASRRTLDLLRRAAPGKRVRYVVATHHHDDHTGGIREFIAESVAVVTTPGNREFFERMARGTFTIAPDAQARVQAPLRLELVTGKRRVFEDGSRRVEVIDIGPSPHADEMLVVHLPAERLLVQGDLLNLPASGRMRPGNLTSRHFLEWIGRSGLAIDRIIPVHGPPHTVDQLREAVRLMERRGE
ncbi:MAG TPA: MBL fold metallo-hydrolase [Gemmatimonadales bacterium]|nr:MBL fold metallo-hydrolase [Gemmatimonadales bacterium]